MQSKIERAERRWPGKRGAQLDVNASLSDRQCDKA
jgi:hypothetical protein